MAKLSQSTRMGSFKCNLGDDALVISRFEGTEALSELFEYRLTVLSEDHNVDFDKILGTNCTLSIKSNYENVKRYFNGVLVEAQWAGRVRSSDGDDFSSYRLILRPWFWLLTRTKNCRIFSQKSVPEIINDVFAKHSFAQSHNEVKLNGSYKPLEYCVQYNETDFAFVSRLMEEYGIYYFFEHSEVDHKMVLIDSNGSLSDKAGGAKLDYYQNDLSAPGRGDALRSIIVDRRFRSGKFTFNDYDYKKPTADLEADKDAGEHYTNASLEMYHFPGRYVEKSDGKSLASVALEAEQAQDRNVLADGDAVTCCPGQLINLVGHSQSSVNKEYVTLRANHAFQSGGYVSGMGDGRESYSGSYIFRAKDMPYRATLRTPKPVIYGPQTALVVSEVDDQCRIKVQFYWDREKSESRYVRIAHGWSGNKWGDIKIPRIGMEVIVEHLNGDPDYPLVTGTVYNADNVAPYDLPSDKSISGVKSDTIDGSGYNEFIFDDRSGDELIRLHAQRNMKSTIENDEDRKIGNKHTEDIGTEWSVTAGQKITFTVGASSITMDPMSIKLSSPNIQLEAQAQLIMTSLGTADLTAGAVTTIKGAVVMIN